MATLRQGFDALAHDEKAKQRHAAGEGPVVLIGHDLGDDLMAEAMAAFAAASPLEVADALSDYVVASSPLVADMPTAGDGLAALAAVEVRPTSPSSGLSDAGAAAHATAKPRPPMVAAIVTLVVTAIVVLVILLSGGGDNESGAELPESTAASVSTVAASSTNPTTPPVVTEASTTVPSSTAPPPTTEAVVVASPIEGRWELAIVVTAVEGPFCGIDEPYTSTVVIGKDDKGQLGVVGLGDDGESWLASFDGTTLTFDGDRFEDDGTTLALFELDLDGDVLTGSESWSWSGGGNSCDKGRSTVAGTRLAG